jgi:hypothetical protein
MSRAIQSERSPLPVRSHPVRNWSAAMGWRMVDISICPVGCCGLVGGRTSPVASGHLHCLATLCLPRLIRTRSPREWCCARSYDRCDPRSVWRQEGLIAEHDHPVRQHPTRLHGVCPRSLHPSDCRIGWKEVRRCSNLCSRCTTGDHFLFEGASLRAHDRAHDAPQALQPAPAEPRWE